jgi:thiamine-phosphate pyrophosphorylase
MFGSRLYAIIDTALAPGPAPLVAEQLLRAGVRVLQYREKGTFRRQSWGECCALAELARSRNARFIVNDRADIALLCGADGVHLGQEDLPAEHARRLLGEGRIIGFSTHTVEQAREADRLPVDYLAIGPVFATTTKQRAEAVVGLETVRAVRAAVRKPLVAIGGITLENAASVIEAGADAVAVIRDLLVAPDVEARARQFLERLAG